MTESAKPKKGLPLALIAIVLALVLIGGGAWWVLFKQPAQAMEIAASDDIPAAAMVKKPVFLPMDKFVVSVQGNNRLHYLMLELSLMSYNQEQMKELEEYTPVIRNAVITKLASKNYDELSSPGVIEPLQGELREHIRSNLSNIASMANVDRVLVTKMVIQ